jgi:1,4-alpha-glucan branching enzyme
VTRLAGPGTRVLLIGTSRYDNAELHDLPAVARNLGGLRERLLALGVERTQIRTLAEPESALDVGEALQEAAEQAEEVLLVYYSGHGILDDEQRLHLAVARSRPDYVVLTSFPFDEVRRRVYYSPAACRVVVLDCCYSGRALEAAMADTGAIVKEETAVLGAYTLTSSSATEASLAPPGAHYTAFTGHLLDVLAGQGRLGAGGLTLRQLDTEVQRRLREAGLPRSRSRADDTAGELVIREALGQSLPAPPPSAGDEPVVPGAAGGEPVAEALSAGEVLRRLPLIADGRDRNPHEVLGPHAAPGLGTSIRVLRPAASSVTVVTEGSERDLIQLHGAGLFGTTLPGTVTDYRLRVTYDDGPGAGRTVLVDDAYRWPPTVGQDDLQLFDQGRHERLWQVLGAHVRRQETSRGQVEGVSFAVWAPNARGVRVTGDFDHWAALAYPMRSLGSSGIWEIFVPGVQPGARYRYHVLGADGVWREKADPLASATEVPPANASIVTESVYEWGDEEWLVDRAGGGPQDRPMSVYEVHVGSWRQGLSYRELADELVDYVHEAGFTHIEFLPVAEHPFSGSLGYQVTGFYAPTARYGTPDDFRHLVDRAHQAGIGVIVDWVPTDFPKDDWALASFDGTPLYEYVDPQMREREDTGTLLFDSGRPQVRNFLVASALFWCLEFHVDGIRAVSVAAMGGWGDSSAESLLRELNSTLYREVPGLVTVADGPENWPGGVTRPTYLGGLGFGLVWNAEWVRASLGHLRLEPASRTDQQEELARLMSRAYAENYLLPLSHDESTPASGALLTHLPGDRREQLATYRAFLGRTWAHPGKQLLFMGGEFAQREPWQESRSLDWWHLDDPAHRAVLELVTELNARYRERPALWVLDDSPDGFERLDTGDVLAFARYSDGDARGRRPDVDVLVCITNLSAVRYSGHRVALPREGTWRVALDTDAERFGGTGTGAGGAEMVQAGEGPWSGHPASAIIDVPPMTTLWLVPAG